LVLFIWGLRGDRPPRTCLKLDEVEFVYGREISMPRVFQSDKFFQPTDGEPVRSVVTESPDAVVVAWSLKPGQEIAAHVHPNGQDTWTILSGSGDYYLDASGARQSIAVGDVVVAPIGAVHGVLNSGDGPLVFISVVSPGDAGYQAVVIAEP
jgi:quercetin dioxygenase-like cupin family protein